MMSSHVKGTGPLAYPDQDPRELRSDIVRAGFERVRSAFARFEKAADDYRRTFADTRSDRLLIGMAWRDQWAARESFLAVALTVERIALDLADSSEVPVIYDADRRGIAPEVGP